MTVLFLSYLAKVVTYFEICIIPSCIFHSPSSNKYWMTSLTLSFSASIFSAISAGVCGFWASNSVIFFFSSSRDFPVSVSVAR